MVVIFINKRLEEKISLILRKKYIIYFFKLLMDLLI